MTITTAYIAISLLVLIVIFLIFICLKLVNRLLEISEDIDSLREMFVKYCDYIESIYGMETFYGDETLQGLVDYSRLIAEELNMFNNFESDVVEEEYKDEEEE